MGSYQTAVLCGLRWLIMAGAAGGALASANAAVSPQPGALEPAAAQFEVEVAKDLWIPMRDGVRLAADLYRPKGVQGRLPVILIRTPYSKDLWPPSDGAFLQATALQ